MLQVTMLPTSLLKWMLAVAFLLRVCVDGRLCDFNSDDCQWRLYPSDQNKTGTGFVPRTRHDVDEFKGSILDINVLYPQGNPDIYLVGGRSKLEGYVVIYKDGRWGTVCHDGWGDLDAKVACRMLGYSGGIAYRYKESYFTPVNESLEAGLMEDIKCKGTETDLRDCKDYQSLQKCNHEEDAGVVCGEDIFALLNGSSPLVGRTKVVTSPKVTGDIRSAWYGRWYRQDLVLSFYSINYGDNSTLVVSLHTQDGSQHIQTLQGSTTQGWIHHVVNFTQNTDEEFYLTLRGQLLSTDGFITIDKMNLNTLSQEGAVMKNICDLSEFDCGGGLCIPRYEYCDLHPDCPNGADEDDSLCGSLPEEMKCSFDNGICGWHSPSESKFKWLYHEKNHPGLEGTYMHTNTGRRRMPKGRGQRPKAELKSAIYVRPPAQVFNQISPYYNMCKLKFSLYKPRNQYLKLTIRGSCGENPSDLILKLFNRTTDRNEAWEYHVVPLVDVGGSYVLKFIATRPYRGEDVRIDNISLSPECFRVHGDADTVLWNITQETGSCDVSPPTTVPVTEIQTDGCVSSPCVNGTCVSMSDGRFTCKCFNGYVGTLCDTSLIGDTPVVYEFYPCSSLGAEGPTQVKCDEYYKTSPVKVKVISEGHLKGIQVWTVPEDGTYLITAIGAAGGGGVKSQAKSYGGYTSGKHNLTAGEHIYILVGQEGTHACSNQMVSIKVKDICKEGQPIAEDEEQYFATHGGGGGGGGGGSFVFKKDKLSDQLVSLIVAGGGGGLAYRTGTAEDSPQEVSLNTRPSSACGYTNPDGAGGGGGWNCTPSGPYLQSGQPLLQGAVGGRSCNKSISSLRWNTPGGFGGGGGACASGGGGGGYSGGNVSLEDDLEHNGGAGTSYYHPDTLYPEVHPGVGHTFGFVEVSLLMNCRCHYICNITDFDKKKYSCICKDGQELGPDRHSCRETNKGLQRADDKDGLELSNVIIIAIATTAFVLIVVSIGVCLYRHHKKQKRSNVTLELGHNASREYTIRTSTHNIGFQARTIAPMGMMAEYNPNYDFVGAKYPEKHLTELNRHKLRLTRPLGQGAFGEVFKGYLAGVPHMVEELPVAVKTLPMYSTEESEMDFLMEAMIMSKFTHPNIVKLLGVCFESHPRYIIIELLEGGDLKTFLRESRPKPGSVSPTLTMADLLKLSIDIAKGCQHLEECHFIHRDIAARNCLLTCKDKDRVAKIADFGMARDIYRSDYYKKGGKAMLPIKWMPPEAFLDGLFTTKTDVWSFGILLWEIFSMGYMPYPGRINQDVMQFVTTGGRLEAPDRCPLPIYQLMSICWAAIPETRPTFSELLEHLERCIQNPEVIDSQLPVFYPIPALEKDRTIIRPADNLPPLAVEPLSEEMFHRDMHDSQSREPLLTPSSCNQEDKSFMHNENNLGSKAMDNVGLQFANLVVRLTPPDSVSKATSESSVHRKSNQSLARSDSSNPSIVPQLLDATTQCGDGKKSAVKSNGVVTHATHLNITSAESSPLLPQGETSSPGSRDNDSSTRSRSENSSVKSTDRRMAASILERLSRGSLKKS